MSHKLSVLILLAISISACGSSEDTVEKPGPAIAQGEYSATQTVTKNTCPWDATGSISGVYTVTIAKDGNYTVSEIQDGSSTAIVMKGSEKGADVELTGTATDQTSDGCVINMNFKEVLSPKGSGFTGTGTDEYHACDGGTCSTSYSITGTKK